MTLRRTPLTRSTPLARMAMARKRVARSPEETRARAIVTARSGGLCEGCGRAPATDWAHRVKRSQGGPWCPTNGLNLCRPCHDWSDHQRNRVEAESIGWMLRRHQDPATTPALLHGRGLVLLAADGNYLPAEKDIA